ncbi:sensor histidine kinase, partial [Candidatus Palauibacter sp.]|uniref:sensor histidine kinase n=1 Tax=Candidatus Palauibacter sp. TaxID=3101350 RepID=UPI003AF20577
MGDGGPRTHRPGAEQPVLERAQHAGPSPPIRVEGAREDGYVSISVADQGRGIPPDRLPNLFRKRTRLAGGTGLGLTICKGLVEAHGGRIRAESEGTGLGARFTFTVPIAPETPAEAPSDDRPPSVERGRRPGSSWSTTTPRRSATCATCFPGRATPRSWRA